MDMNVKYPHQPVLVCQIVKFLVHTPDGVYVDATAGSGGHSEAIIKRLSGKGRIICLDRDPEAVKLTRGRVACLGARAGVIKANYIDLDGVLKDLGIDAVDGMLLDLGMSSYQIEKSGRGFSFLRDEPLDMRMDPEEEATARDLINNLPEDKLVQLLKDYGEEKRSKSIVRAIIRERQQQPIETSAQLASLIKSIAPRVHRLQPRHPATRTFQALRIAVNQELHNIKLFLLKAPGLLAKKGRLAALSYHSLEDRLIKQAMVDWEQPCACPPNFPTCVCGKVPLMRRIQKRGIKPTQKEIEDNPRARSAMLRVAERI
jgi:16S rRNA (cytosine1402-N4)-methyltransferase